jgi:hypothetical protein
MFGHSYPYFETALLPSVVISYFRDKKSYLRARKPRDIYLCLRYFEVTKKVIGVTVAPDP